MRMKVGESKDWWGGGRREREGERK